MIKGVLFVKKIISFVWRYSKEFVFSWLIYVILCGVLSGFSMIQPVINGKLIDYLSSPKDGSNKILLEYVGAIIIFFLVTSVLKYVVDRIYTTLQLKIGYRINMAVTKHVLRVPFSFVYKKNSVYISELINNESCAITSFSLDIIQDVIKNIILIVVGFVLVIKYMGVMGFIVGAAIAMAIVVVINLFDTKVHKSEEVAKRYNVSVLGEIYQ